MRKLVRRWGLGGRVSRRRRRREGRASTGPPAAVPSQTVPRLGLFGKSPASVVRSSSQQGLVYPQSNVPSLADLSQEVFLIGDGKTRQWPAPCANALPPSSVPWLRISSLSQPSPAVVQSAGAEWPHEKALLPQGRATERGTDRQFRRGPSGQNLRRQARNQWRLAYRPHRSGSLGIQVSHASQRRAPFMFWPIALALLV